MTRTLSRNGKVALVAAGVAVALAAGSTAAIALSHGGLGGGIAGVRPMAPDLPGAVVAVTTADMGAMMGRAATGSNGQARATWTGPMRIWTSRTGVPAGRVSLRVTNAGVYTHEVVVLPLAEGASVGQRSVGSDGRIAETGSLGEASNDNGAGKGEGIKPGGISWVTLDLKPGRYELACNLPGHYAAGMFAELDVTA